jgi:hypothetical protein
MSRSVVAILALVILASGAVVATEAALEDAGEDRVVTNETWTPDAGNVTTLDESNRDGAYYAQNATVYDETDTEMDAGTDYEWVAGNGTVRARSGGGLDGDSEATISYAFSQTTAEQRQLAGALGELPQMLGLVLPAALAFLFFAMLRG